VEIHVLQGEREMAVYNNTLGKFQLTNIPPAPRGVPQIEVTFDIDANGIVNVSAKDRGTGKEQSMTITGQSALPKDDIDRMVRDAEQHAEEDRKRREEAEVRNTADNLLYQTEKLVKDNDDKISAEHKAKLEQTQGQLREALKGDDVQSVRNASDELMRVSQEIGQALYASGSADQAGQQTTGGFAGDGATGTDDDIVDAEVVDEGDEDDKGAA
jgi:molecular chaperone DnaK